MTEGLWLKVSSAEVNHFSESLMNAVIKTTVLLNEGAHGHRAGNCAARPHRVYVCLTKHGRSRLLHSDC
jgi:hypothetical protein